MAAKFKGKLNQRLEPIFFGIISEEEARQQRAPLIAERLALILEHYGITDTNHEQQMTKLAHCLLRDFVKGFQVADPYKSVGAKGVWNVVRLSFLVCEMERCIKETTPVRTQLEAAKLLAQREPWKTICAMGAHQKKGNRLDESAETLRHRYSISKRSTPDFARRQYERQITGRRRNKFDSYDSMLSHIAKSEVRLPFI